MDGVIILGIETATLQAGCALGGVEGVLASFHTAHGPRHAEVLTPAVEFICSQARISLDQVTVVAVDVGPGLFTGLRVGLATAKAVAQGLRAPMIGIPSLDLLAFPFRHSGRVVVPVIDARRGEVYSALYKQVPGGLQRLTPHNVGSPAELASELMARNDECLLVGDGAIRYAEEFSVLRPRVEIVDSSPYPSAAALVELAQAQALREEWVQPSEIHALYLRKSDAEIKWENRTAGAWRGSMD
ncbi:MAG TPA: tRNA (adenosine(37)-N6)-threonylcarbamoyltransferase complex dimerization subunit type 1 TsaB [Acidimicrobiales bacterium]|nr:tRNA (adenosine(37)-N6)-threonylcarbamoyltransferase complex dimerization subunit type 1 TsaB [Acidimicrobiales bacterium]